MSNINDKATVSLFVNGEQAESAMDRLRKKAEDLDKQLQTAMAAGDKKSANKLRHELDRVTKELNKTESAAKGTGIVLNDLGNTSIHGLRNALKYLQRELSMTKPNSEQWHKYADQIELVKGRIAELNNELEGGQSLWARFKSWAEDTWPAIDLLTKGYDAAVSSLREYVDAYASMDQELANVRKFTGMTAEQVEDLNEEFKKMDTRTTREGLNQLAQEAGRLGKTSKEDVLGYVRAADQINVALDDLGDGATLTLSKLTGVFGIENIYGTEQSLLKVGSVVNELSQNCRASAPYLTNFAERMGGVGAQAGMTIDQIMGLGAVLDSNAMAVEASSTAISQVLVRMMQDPAKYAKVAGLEVESFAEKLRTDANGALLEFLDALNKAGGMDVLSPMFKDMGENGSRAIASLSTLAIHIDDVRAQQEAAAAAFREGTSVGNEFSVQNDTVAAALEKCKNRANELKVELGERLYPLMKHFLTTGSAIMRGLLITIRFVAEHKAAIIALTAAVAAYHIVLSKEIIIKKIRNAIDTIHYGYLVLESKATKTLTLVTEGLRLVYFRLTGQTSKAIMAQKAFSAAMAATPWGAILTAITVALVAFKSFGDEVEDLTVDLDTLKKGQEEANIRLAEERAILQQNINTLQTFNGTKSQEQQLIQQLNEKYGGFFGTCSTLKEWYETLTSKGNDYCNSIYQQILMEAKRQQALDLAKKANEAREKGLNGEGITNGDNLYEFIENLKYLPSWDHLSWDEAYDAVYDRNKAKWDQYADALEARAQQMMRDYATEVASLNPFTASTTTTTTPTIEPTVLPPGDTTHDRFAIEKAARERAEAVARISYAKGESDYETYTQRMNEIAVNYYNMLRERTDLSANEHLSIQADYWEAVNKQTKAQNSQLIAEETQDYNDSLARLREAFVARLEVGNMSAEERQNVEDVYNESVELAELEHLRRLVELTKEGTEDRRKAEQQYLDARLRAAQRHQQEYESKQAEHERKLASFKDKYFGLNADEKQAAYDNDIAALTEVYNAEIRAAGNNAEERLRIEEAFQQAKLALQRQYGLLAEEDTRNSMQKSVDSSLEWLNGDGGQALTGTLRTLTSGMSSIFSGLSTLIQAELEIQTAKIEKRYDREIEMAQGNSYKVAKLEKQKEKELAKAKNEANKKMFAMQVIQAVAQTAQNALSAYGSAAAIPVVGYILAPIAAAMAVAAGAIQIAAIKKQQQASEAQGYSKGGFTKPGAVDEPAGIVHAGEWVASQKLLANPVARPMIEALDRAQRTNTIGSLKPEDVSRSIRANDSLARIAEDDNQGALMVAAFAQNSQAVGALVERLNEPFVTVNTVTGDHGIKQAQDEYSRLMDNVTPKSKRKK
jgi:TP901 family phage tail tape measure protein